ncbi:MAG: hypothetical protein RLZZ288_292, partial [Planctomycetota bacterium]
PHGIRGRPSGRDLRDAVIELCARASSESADASAFAAALERLRAIAELGELHGMDAATVRAMTVEAMRGAAGARS